MGTGGKVGIGPPESEPVLRSMQEMWVDLLWEGRIGTFDQPREYFHGQLVFYYGFFNIVDPPVFFLLGATDHTIVALGGSQKHARGHRGGEIPVADSAGAVVMEPDVAEFIYQTEVGSSRAEMESPPQAPVDDIRADHVALLYENWRFTRGSKMAFEVLARTELESSVSSPVAESQDVLFGSPVFVAQTN
jgi:hypothetical protein